MSNKASFKDSFVSFSISLIILLMIRWAVVEPYVIPSGSMIPTLLVHDHLFVSKWSYGLRWPFSSEWITGITYPERGEIVVFRSVKDSEFFMIKRVVGLPGDKIKIHRNGSLEINGENLRRDPLEKWPADYYQLNEDDLGEYFEDVSLFRETNTFKSYLIVQTSDLDRSFEEEFFVPKGHLFVMGDNRDHSSDSRYWGYLPVENLLGKAQFIWLSCEQTFASAPFLCNPLTTRWSRLFKGVQ